MITVRIIAPDLVDVTVRPSWWRRLLGARAEMFRAFRSFQPPHDWRCEDPPFRLVYVDFGASVTSAIEREFRAETARNYQAAAQRGEYPIR